MYSQFTVHNILVKEAGTISQSRKEIYKLGSFRVVASMTGPKNSCEAGYRRMPCVHKSIVLPRLNWREDKYRVHRKV